MRVRYAFLVLASVVLCTASAHAAPASDLRSMLKKLSDSIPVPPEWAGVWAITDTSYKCTPFSFQSASADTDTLCTGQQVSAPSGGFNFTIDCTGSSNATEFHQHCTGSGEIVTGCNVTIDMQIDGTRTADSYYVVNTTNITYSGAACPVPPQCFIDHSRGQRIAPEPLAWCATPAKPATWGSVKAAYR